MRDFAWHFTNTFLSRTLVLIFSIILAKLLTPSEVGTFSAVILLVSYCHLFLGLQLNAGIVQKLSDDKLQHARDGYFTAGLVLTCVVGMTSIAGGLPALPYLRKAFQLHIDGPLLLVCLSLVLWRLLKEYFGRVLQAEQRFRECALYNIYSGIVQVALLAAALSFNRSVWMAVGAMYVGTVLGTLALARACFTRRRINLSRQAYIAGKDLVMFCSTIYLVAMAVFLDTKIDVTLVNYFLEKDALALYSYAVELALILTMVGDTITQVIYPRLSNAFSRSSYDEVQYIYRQAMTFSFLIVSIAALFVIAHAEFLVPLLLSEFYVEMVPSLVILCTGIVLFATVSSVGTTLTAKGIPIYDALAVWLSLGLNVVLNLILIPRLGIVGAAIATTSSFIIRAVVAVVLIELKIGTMYRYRKILLMYGLFLVCVIGEFIVLPNSLAIREILILAFAGVCLYYFCEEDQRRLLTSALRLSAVKK